MGPVSTTRVGICLVAALAWGAPARAQGDLGPRLDEHLQRLVPWGFSGSVLVARSGRVVLAAGYGFADRALTRPNTGQTLFPLGALSQQFTAAALLTLVEQGRANLDDPLSAHLDGVPADKQAITLRHLILQQSGLPQDVGALFGPVETKEDTLARILAAPLEFAPGDRYSPSNAGCALVCAVVERIAGVPYDEYLRKRLLEPAGMGQTQFVGEVRAGSAVVAESFDVEAERGTPLSWADSWPLRGAGNLLSSVGDLYRWERALGMGEILAEGSLETLQTASKGDFAPGIFVARNDAGRRIGARSSMMGGFQGELRRGMDDPLTWILLSNEPMPAIVAHIDALVAGRALELPPEVGEFDPRAAAAAAGAYELPGGGRLRIGIERGRLSISAENQGGVDALSPPDAAATAWQAEWGGRSLTLCEHLRGRDFPAAANLLSRSAQSIDEELGTWWRQLEARWGAAGAPRLVACLPRERSVVLRLEFERGSELCWMTWSGPTLERFGPGPASFLPTRLWPAKEGGLVTYVPSTLAVRRLNLLLRADGSVRGLAFQSDATKTGEGADASELGARRLD